MKAVAVIFANLLSIAVIATVSWAGQEVPNPRDVVSPQAYASMDPAGRGSTFQIAVVLKIRTGFHINAHDKSEGYLIATDLQVNAPTGFKAGEVSYSKGQLKKFSFSKSPLNVYQDTATLRLPVTALSDAPLGEQKIPMKIHFQACSNEYCLPPVWLDVETKINVAASANASRPAHSEWFPSPR